MTDGMAQSTISRWSTVAAVFGGVCNLLCLILEHYQFDFLARVPLTWNVSSIFSGAIGFAPLLALFVWRRSMPVVLILASSLFLILSWRIYHLVQYFYFGGSLLFYKIDSPGLLLMLLGFISMAVVVTRAAICFAVFIVRAVWRSQSAS